MTAATAADTATTCCSDASTAAGEALEGTASRTVSWLVVEHRASWGRDAVADSGLPAEVVAALGAFPGRVLLIRRPGRRGAELLAFRAETTEAGGTLTRYRHAGIHALAGLPDDGDLDTLGEGEPLTEPLVLVCSHGRRDRCCTRLGIPVYDALGAHLGPEALWQSSHQGGHRFAANVLALPAGVQLGRVAPEDAAHVAAMLRRGRIPLAHYRGRTAYPAHVQAGEIAVRRRLGIDALDGLRLLGSVGTGDGNVTFAHAAGEITVHVEERPGPVLPVSCGAEPEATVRFAVAF